MGSRFYHGSIYDVLMKKTKKQVGPGAYKDEVVTSKLKKKPCMSKFYRPYLSDREDCYEIVGNVRLLQKGYLPRDART